MLSNHFRSRSFHMCRILLVDDDETLRSTLSAFLSRLGLGTPVQASNGAEALLSLSALPPDLVITDCQMPTMDGIAFVRALRSQGHAMPVIMLSGQSDPQVTQLAFRAGVTEYLEKPLSPPQLIRAIRQMAASAQTPAPQAA
jgi:CheY-like chemotaxis protein